MRWRGILGALGLALASVAAHATPPTNNCVSMQGGSVVPCTPVSNADGSNIGSGPVSGNVGGYDSGPITASATPANSSHAAGVSVGGLLSLPIARTNGGSGIITNFVWTSTGGSTGQYVIRIWSKNPANTTCTDNTAFAGSAVDDAFLITPPFTVTPAAPANTTGDSKTYASALNLAFDYKNADTSPGQNVYLCAVTVATNTADENKAVTAMVSGTQN